MQIEMRYGRGHLTASLPNDAEVTVIRKTAMPLVNNVANSVATALRQPVQSPSLEYLASQAKTACIAICDITRPVPNSIFLRPIIESLLHAGIPVSAITILVATGLHRPNLGAELAELVGDPWVLEHIRIVNHDAHNDADHVEIGKTPDRGTVVRLDRRFVEADLRIATGLVEPHFMAGYSGGRKVIAPGIAHAETITTFHNSRFMADPFAANCNLHKNPLHEEQLAIVKMLGGALALNTVIDEHRQLSFVNFGEIIASHLEAVAFVRKYCEISVPRRYPTVLTSAAGYPLDTTYYQTVKGMVGGIDILEPGGDLIIVSACSEGFGSTEFRTAQETLVQQGPDQFLQQIFRQSHAKVDEWQTQMQLKAMAAGRIHLFAEGLRESDRLATGVNVIANVSQAVQDIVASKRDRAIAIIPEGPYVVPYHQPHR
ncbi:MAG: nickel-dependent lactate racemase [Planctomycetota bacterium]|nr:nickel-dependent lactate racemase [Planctomycetota bacterium]MDA1178010.1 nickel-dependent lactate racemase [Planctomycetota bacterium]